MTTKINLLTSNSKIPEPATSESVGYDLTCTDISADDNIITCHLGISIEPPDGYAAYILPRSSLSKTGWMLGNSIGLIDPDYRGELQMKFIQVDEERRFPYNIGDRVGQLILLPIIKTDFQISNLSYTKRGKGGFGSTGQ